MQTIGKFQPLASRLKTPAGGGFTPWITLPLVFIIRRSADFSLDSSFILSFRITTTIHSIVQFVIICWKQLSVASQLLLRRHLCLPADVIRRIIDKYAGPSANLEGFTLSLYLLVRFARFFRYDELSNIAPVHLKFWPEYMRVFVLRARGDIYREGNYVYVKRLGNNFCLLTLLERYILMRDIILSSSVALFRPVRLFICSLNCLSNQPSSFSGYVSLVLKGEIIYVRLSVATSNIITLAALRVNNQELTLISFPMR